MYRVAWLGDQWIGVGAPYQGIYTSPDGENWTRHGTGALGGLTGVARSDSGRLVAVGRYGTTNLILISDDEGQTWLDKSFDGPALEDVVWTPGGFFAVGGIRGNAPDIWGGIWFSLDGMDWELRYESATLLTGIAWTGSRVVAAGRRFEPPDSSTPISAVLSSENGKNWTLVHEGKESLPRKVRWLDDACYAVGHGRILRSIDGLHWTVEGPNIPLLDAVAGPPGNRVAGGLGTLKSKVGGGAWVEETQGLHDLFAFATNGTQTVAVSVSDRHGILGSSFSRGTIYSSADGGKTLNLVFSNPDVALGSPVYHGGMFIVPALNGTVLTSIDGLTWTEEYTGESRAMNATAVHDGTVIMVGGRCEVRHRSPEGEWTLVSGGSTLATLLAVTRTHDGWVAVGGETRTSTDGLLWTRVNPGTNRKLHGIATIGDISVAAGDYGTVTVRDATGAWKLVERFSEGYFHSVLVFRGRFYISDLDGDVWSSWDGMAWRREERIPGARLRRLDLVGERLISSGYWGDVIVSAAPPPIQGSPLTFQEWIEENGETLPEDSLGPSDPTGPLQIPNLLAYGLGVIPSEASHADLPGFHAELDSSASGIFEYRRNRRAQDLSYQVVHSSDLIQWQEIEPQDHRLIGLDATHEIWQARVRTDAGTSAFLRLNVSASNE